VFNDIVEKIAQEKSVTRSPPP